MECKIIQIIPAPPELFAAFHQGNGMRACSKALCLALIEDTYGHRWVDTIDLSDDGIALPSEQASNFEGLYIRRDHIDDWYFEEEAQDE